MRFELQFKIFGNLNILNDKIEIKHYPHIIKLFKEKENHYISISKEIFSNSSCLPTFKNNNQNKEIVLPSESSYSEMIEIINHIESFGTIDNKFDYIDKINFKLKWISENENDHFSPLAEFEIKMDNLQDFDLISENWLNSTVIHKRQLGDLYIPFSFYGYGKNLFHNGKYQTSFCTFYLMLEYFFYDKKKNWGINNNAYKFYTSLNTSLNNTLHQIQTYPNHYDWLQKELKLRKKELNESSLLYLINIYRNEFSHLTDNNKKRNVFNEHKYFSIAFIMLVLCNFVSIKKRLSPFVNPSDLENFYRR